MELARLVLKRFLLLALLLDRAVSGQPGGCPDGTPLLFRRGQPLKSSAEASPSHNIAPLMPRWPALNLWRRLQHPCPSSNMPSTHRFHFIAAVASAVGIHYAKGLSIRGATPDQAVEHFLRGRMRGEGDVMRHLGSMGFRLAYVQDPRSEFDFAVASLGTDLRSGVRLLRLAELLIGG